MADFLKLCEQVPWRSKKKLASSVEGFIADVLQSSFVCKNVLEWRILIRNIFMINGSVYYTVQSYSKYRSNPWNLIKLRLLNSQLVSTILLVSRYSLSTEEFCITTRLPSCLISGIANPY